MIGQLLSHTCTLVIPCWTHLAWNTRWHEVHLYPWVKNELMVLEQREHASFLASLLIRVSLWTWLKLERTVAVDEGVDEATDAETDSWLPALSGCRERGDADIPVPDTFSRRLSRLPLHLSTDPSTLILLPPSLLSLLEGQKTKTTIFENQWKMQWNNSFTC